MQRKSIHIGTSGWNYQHWKVHFSFEDLIYTGWYDVHQQGNPCYKQ